MKTGLLLTAAAAAMLIRGNAAQAAQDFVTLQDTTAGAVTTVATGINNAGQIVGYYVDASAVTHGFGYSGGSYTTIDVPSSSATTASGISNGGQVTGSYTDGSGGSHGYFQTGFAGSQTSLDNPSGVGNTTASGINDGGTIVGSFYNGTTTHGFVDVGGVYTQVDDPLGVKTSVYGIDTKGDIVVSYVDGGGVTHGFVDLGGTLSTIDNPNAGPGQATEVFGINNQLMVVGYYVAPNSVISGFTAEVPEPGTLALFGLASLGIVTLRRRRDLAG